MFDAKSILEALVKGAAPQQPGSQQGGGLGGLAEILGQVLGGGQGGANRNQPEGGASRGQPGSGAGGMPGLDDLLRNAFPGGGASRSGGQSSGQNGGQSGSASGGGLGDILAELQKRMGGPASAPGAAPSQGGGRAAGDGGLGDILGELQKRMGGQSSTPGASAGSGAGGSIIDVLGQILGQATAGVKDGAQRIDQSTGASGHMRDAVGKATGRSPEDLLEQLKELIQNNKLGAGAAMGGLGGLVLGTRTGRSIAGAAVKLGALALIGGLAYKALQNYSQGRPVISSGNDLPAPAPHGSGFEEQAVTNEAATTYIRGMIAAAAADGRLDADEQQRILGSLRNAGLDAEAEEFLANEINNPASVEDLVAGVRTREEAVQLYTAARLAIEPDTAAEQRFLAALADRIGIDRNLAAHIDAATRPT